MLLVPTWSSGGFEMEQSLNSAPKIWRSLSLVKLCPFGSLCSRHIRKVPDNWTLALLSAFCSDQLADPTTQTWLSSRVVQLPPCTSAQLTLSLVFLLAETVQILDKPLA